MILPASFLDLETVLRPTAPPYDPTGDKFPAAVHWQIVCAGVGRISKTDEVSVASACVSDEPALLMRIARRISTADDVLVTYNGRGFDLPVVVAACMRYRVALPWWFNRATRMRYSTEGHLDLADELSDYGAGRAAKLDAWADACGTDGKTESGNDVAKLWRTGQKRRIAEYCAQDVRITMSVFARWLLVRGELSHDREAALQASIATATSVIEHDGEAVTNG